MRQQSDVNVIRDVEGTHILANATRIRILGLLQNPDSATGLSSRLGLSRQKVNYHLRQLEKRGFVEQVEERRKGNCRERILRASSKAYYLDPQALRSLATTPADVKDKFSSSYLIAVAADVVREVASLQERSHASQKTLPTLTLNSSVRFANPEARNRFTNELLETIAHLVSKYNDETSPRGRSFKLVAGAYPAATTNQGSE